MIADDGGDEDRTLTRMRGVGANLPLKSNGTFVARARTDLPAVVRELQKARPLIVELEKRVSELRQENSEMARMLAEPSESMVRIAELERERDEIKATELHRRKVFVADAREFGRISAVISKERDEAREQLAASQLALAQIREAVEWEPHSDICKYFIDNFRCAGVKGLTGKNCNCLKSRIPTVPDSALVEAVKEVVAANRDRINDGDINHAHRRTLKALDALDRLAPEAWKK